MALPRDLSKPWLWNRVYPILSRINRAPGCYAVCVRGELVYIGQSMNLHARFVKHGLCVGADGFRTRWGHFVQGELKVKIAYGRKFGDWLMREVRLIRRLRPRFNVKIYGGETSYDNAIEQAE